MKNGLTSSVGVFMVLIVSMSINTAFDGGPSYAINITAFIHFNEEAIKEDNYGGDLDDIRFYVDGKNYSSSFWDTIDWVYPDVPDEPNYDTLEKELVVADNATEICLEDGQKYKVCSRIENTQCSMVACNQIPSNVKEIHFTYPASWQKED